MKNIAYFLICTLLFTISAHAQEAASSRYFEERARGDAAADASRLAFSTSVCEAAVATFCPNFKRSPQKTCFETQRQCGSPHTVVEKRFISKYGVGLVSANREVLPTIKRIFQVLKEIESKRRNIPASVQTRIPFIEKETGLNSHEIENKFILFSEQYFPKKLKTITIDYWGYFQQMVPGRPEFNFDERSQTGSLKLNFRWCSQQKRFVDESSRMVGDVLSVGIMGSQKIETFLSGEYYQNKCDSLPVERGDK